MDTISKLFKGVDSSAAGSFLALQWVKGYPVTDNIKTDLPWKDNIEFANWLYANDQKGVSWK
jgi:hypothetical protein